MKTGHIHTTPKSFSISHSSLLWFLFFFPSFPSTASISPLPNTSFYSLPFPSHHPLPHLAPPVISVSICLASYGALPRDFPASPHHRPNSSSAHAPYLTSFFGLSDAMFTITTITSITAIHLLTPPRFAPSRLAPHNHSPVRLSPGSSLIITLISWLFFAFLTSPAMGSGCLIDGGGGGGARGVLVDCLLPWRLEK